MPRSRTLYGLGAGVLVVGAVGAVLAFCLDDEPSASKPTPAQVVTILAQGGQDTQVQKRGNQADPDGASFATQYFSALDQVSADLIQRARSAHLDVRCTQGLSQLPADDVRAQVWASLPAQTCTVAAAGHTYGPVWIVEHSSGGANAGAYIGVEGDLYR